MDTYILRRFFGVLLVLGLLATACGSETSTTTSTPATTTTATTTTAPPGAETTTTTVVASSTSQPPDTQTIHVFFATGDGSDCGEVSRFDREIDAALDPIIMAFELLVAGPTVEEMDAGAGSVFSSESEGAIRTIWMLDQLLVVDLRDVRQLLSNASTSCGSESLLAQLNATAFQFDAVERARYEIEGSCNLFSNWLQRECTEYTRGGAEPGPPSTNERALGSGCTPGTENLPDGRWFGFVTATVDAALEFDLACWFSGSAAADAAAEDGEESPPPNDYYIRNESDRLRTVPVSGSASVMWLPTGDPADTAAISYAEWAGGRSARSYLPGVWLEIVDGEVTLIEEQYVP